MEVLHSCILVEYILPNYFVYYHIPQRTVRYALPRAKTLGMFLPHVVELIVTSIKFQICSLGNPGPTYDNTRHAAGHFILHRLSPLLHSSPIPLSRDRTYGGLVAFDHTFTLFQSPTLMNVSGRAVRSAWKAFKSSLAPKDMQEARLVVLHDELEKDLGKVKLKVTGSGGGQKGIEDCIKALSTSVGFLREAQIITV